ncbi:MAG: YncE family protein [Gammaproteobacteria bacterium]|nr:YncE family protein [Gammaproteobacteria bacterium]
MKRFLFGVAVGCGIGLSAALPARAAPTVYVPLGHANAVAVIDAAEDRVVDRITGVHNAHGLAVTPDGSTLVAGSLLARAGDRPPERPAGVSEEEHAAHHGGAGAASAGSGKVASLYIIDRAGRAVVRTVDVPGAVHHTAVTAEGRYAVSTHPQGGGISVVDLRRGEVVRFVATGPTPNYPVAGPGAVYVSNAGNDTVSVLDPERWIVRRNIVVGAKPEHMALGPHGRTLYVANVGDGTVSAIDLVQGAVVQTYQVGGQIHGVDVAPSGEVLYASSKDREKVTAIDLATGERRERALAPAPYHLMAVPGTGKVYVSSRAAPKVWVLDAKTLARRGTLEMPGGVAHQMVTVP